MTGAIAGGGGKDDPESKCEFDMADLRVASYNNSCQAV